MSAVRVVRTGHWSVVADGLMVVTLSQFEDYRTFLRVNNITAVCLLTSILAVYQQLSNLLTQCYVIDNVLSLLLIDWTDLIRALHHTVFAEGMLRSEK